MESQNLKVLPEIDPKLCSAETSFTYENKLEEIVEPSVAET